MRKGYYSPSRKALVFGMVVLFLAAPAVAILLNPLHAEALSPHFQVDASGTLTTDLISYYPMEGNSNDYFASSSYNGADTSISYGSSYGKVSQGSHNTGSGYIALPTFTITSAISIAGWFRSTDTSGSHDFIVDINNSGGTARIGVQLDSGKVIVSSYNGSANPVIYSSVNTYEDGNWHFFVVTANGSNLTLQIDNGIQQSASAGQNSWGGNANRISNLYADSQGFNGDIDEVGIWNKVLSSQEITDLYNSGNGQTLVDGVTLLNLQQYESDATTTIAEGGTTTSSIVIFGGTVGGSTSSLQLQVDVQPASTTLLSTDAPTATSTFVSANENATTTFIGSNGSYHWQARAMDENGVTSTWRLFGPTATSTDFFIDVPATTTPQFQVDTDGTLTTDLVSYYRMEGDATDYWGANNGVGTSIFYGTQYGRVNQGSHNFATGNIALPTFTVTSTISAALWFRSTSTSDRFIFSLNNASNTQKFCFQLTDGRIIAQTYNGSTAHLLYSTSNTLNDGNWHFVVFTANSTTSTLSIDDGTPQSTSQSLTTWGGDNNNISSNDSGVQSFNGDIDEVGIWSKVLSSQEITDLYNSGLGQTLVTGPSLLGLQQYESDATTTIEDGATTTQPSVIFGANLYGLSTSTLQLQIDVQPASTTLLNTDAPNVTSTFVSPGSSTQATFFGSNDSYHWQARVMSSSGATSTWQLYGPSTTSTDFTMAIEPIVVVPGIMGSKLNQASDSAEIWPNAEEMATNFAADPLNPDDSYLYPLELQSGGQPVPGESIYPSDILRVATATTDSGSYEEIYYQNLIQQLVNDGYTEGTNLFLAYYDWRFSEASSAITIAPVIASATAASPDGQINVIAHSMGGMVMKSYLQNATDTSFIDKLILAGVPQLGAPEAFGVLNYGSSLGIDVPLPFLGETNVLNYAEIQAISEEMPGIYDLLPSPQYITDNGGYVQVGTSSPLDYDDTNNFMASNTDALVDTTLLSRSDTFHESIDDEQFNVPSSSVYNIMGCNRPTIGTFEINSSNLSDLDVIPTTGDGTVPLTSAENQFYGYNNYFIAPASSSDEDDHQGLVRDTSSLELIQGILNGNPINLPEYIATSSDACFNVDTADAVSYWSFSTHSPVELNVYDEQGNHVGPNNQTHTIDQNIPDSLYYTITHNDFAIVPANQDYKIVINATGVGTFTLDIDKYNNRFQRESETTYLSVPVPNTQTTAEVDITATSVGPTLTLDTNGDMDVSSSYQPSTITNFEVVPPPPTFELPNPIPKHESKPFSPPSTTSVFATSSPNNYLTTIVTEASSSPDIRLTSSTYYSITSQTSSDP
jgi:pimeloyl-ACP methyl ester carboxylesterase